MKESRKEGVEEVKEGGSHGRGESRKGGVKEGESQGRRESRKEGVKERGIKGRRRANR